MKPSNSIESGAESVAVTHEKNGLASFLNKRAVLSRIRLALVCFLKPLKSIVSGAESVAVTHEKNGLARFLNKSAVLSHIGLSYNLS